MNSPAEVQKTILRRQLKHAVTLGKPLTIHTREADEDIELILKEEVPKDHRVRRLLHSSGYHPDPHKDTRALLYGFSRSSPALVSTLPELIHWGDR